MGKIAKGKGGEGLILWSRKGAGDAGKEGGGGRKVGGRVELGEGREKKDMRSEGREIRRNKCTRVVSYLHLFG